MPQRQSTFKVDSEKVQGTGSYVLFRHVEYGLIAEAAEKAGGTTNSREEKEFTDRLLRDAVIEWNWVDDDGNTLPLPKDGLDIGKLLDHEVMFLVDAVLGREAIKNSR